MKKNSIVLILLAALGLATSCATDELVTPNPEGTPPTPGQQVTITASLGNGGDNSSNSNSGNGSTDKPGTRMGYEPDDAGTGLKTTWATGDAFSIWPFSYYSQPTGEAQTFTLATGAGTDKGTFTGTAPAKGDIYHIFHPASIKTVDNFINFPYTEQKQTGNDNRSHLTAFHSIVLITTDYMTLDFSSSNQIQGQSSCMKFILTPGAAITPTKITLASADGSNCFYTTNEDTNDASILSLGLQNITLTGTTGDDGTITAYMMMSCKNVTLPAAGIIVTVDAADGSSYTQTISFDKETTLAGGLMHTIIAKNMKKVELPSMKFTVKVTESDKTFNIPFSTGGITLADMTVTWEEGGTTVKIPAGTKLTDNADDVFNYTYSKAGTYTITITSAQTDATKQQIPNFNFTNNRKDDGSNPPKLISIETPLLNAGSVSFYECTALTTIPEDLFKYNTKAMYFNDCFRGCTALTKIPKGLFTYNTKAVYFSYCFSGCTALTDIPAGLFDNNKEVTDFSYCFSDCTALTAIPAGLFDNNEKAEYFSNCFDYCTELTIIPEGLFANNKAATNFSDCFNNCTELTTIPEGLFANNKAATNFSDCFNNCYFVKLHAKIFSMDGNIDNNPRFSGKPMYFDGCFCNAGCYLMDATASVAPQLWKYATGGVTWTTIGCFENCNANNSWDGMDESTWGTPTS